MILSLLISLLYFSPQDTIPYKPTSDFELIVNYSLKENQPGIDRFHPELSYKSNSVNPGNNSKGAAAFLTVDINKINLLDEEVRYKIVDSFGKPVSSQKIKKGNTIHLPLDFIDDMKKGAAANGYKIIFLNKNKVDISQIDIRVLDDGAFIVNGEKRGQF